MFADILNAARDCFSRPMAGVLAKSAGATFLILFGLGWGLAALPWPRPDLPWDWADKALSALGLVGLWAGLLVLSLPVLGLVVGFFLEDVAGAVERRAYPDLPPAQPAPFTDQLFAGLDFARTLLFWNLLALPFYLLAPGFNLLIYFLLNATLIGREYFELVALRRMTAAEMRRVRRAHRGRLFVSGAVLAGLCLIPGVNLVVPLFGTAFMVRTARRIAPALPVSGAGGVSNADPGGTRGR